MHTAQYAIFIILCYTILQKCVSNSITLLLHENYRTYYLAEHIAAVHIGFLTLILKDSEILLPRDFEKSKFAIDIRYLYTYILI